MILGFLFIYCILAVPVDRLAIEERGFVDPCLDYTRLKTPRGANSTSGSNSAWRFSETLSMSPTIDSSSDLKAHLSVGNRSSCNSLH